METDADWFKQMSKRAKQREKTGNSDLYPLTWMAESNRKAIKDKEEKAIAKERRRQEWLESPQRRKGIELAKQRRSLKARRKRNGKKNAGSLSLLLAIIGITAIASRFIPRQPVIRRWNGR